MLLTLMYMAATWMQSWKIKSISLKIAQQLNQHLTIVYYNIQYPEHLIRQHQKAPLLNDGNINACNPRQAASDLSTNYADARIINILWYHETQRGVALYPQQNIHLGSWITFPKLPNLIPFDFHENSELLLDTENEICLLLETDLTPDRNDAENNSIVLLENFGRPLAWKMDSRFSIILKTDLNLFTKLVITTFIQNSLKVNDWLPLIRIESVTTEGIPQPYDLIKQHSSKESVNRSSKYLTKSQWEKYVNGLRQYTVLAGQAYEYKPNFNPTEGKTSETFKSNKSLQNASDEVTNNITLRNELMNESVSSIAVINTSSSRTLSPFKIILEDANRDTELSNQKSKNIVFNDIDTGIVHESIPNSKIDEVLGNLSYSNQSVNDILDDCCNDKLHIVDSLTIDEKENTQTEEELSQTEAHKLSTIGNWSSRRLKDSKYSDNNIIKPPNILVYSESIVTRDNVISTLKHILEVDVYTIYPLLLLDIKKQIWMDNAVLLIVCGSVNHAIGVLLTEYFLNGGNMLCLCSDVLHIILPTYRTAEVREQELVQFSYGRWHKIKMMHHIFCYQPSPVKKHFSTESDCDSSSSSHIPNVNRKPVMVCPPRSIAVKDLQGAQHNLQVHVLGTEETWNTPSLLLAINNDLDNGDGDGDGDSDGGTTIKGKAVFSQVHLEMDPNSYEHDESKHQILKENNSARLEIFRDILKNHLNMIVKDHFSNNNHPSQHKTEIVSGDSITLNMHPDTNNYIYSHGYFLGRYELKSEFLEKIKLKVDLQSSSLNTNTTNYDNDGLYLKLDNLTVKFCGRNDSILRANNQHLPILIHACPDDFSTLEYFDNLKTEKIGRIAIYSPILTSTMNFISNITLVHGLAVITRQQTRGSGRNDNQWLSPVGCAMFSLQLHIPLDTPLGQRISLIQHLIAVAVVNALKNIKEYENLNISVKWPNDIYANGKIKIGGLIINSQIDSAQAICNVGCGINLNNSKPTICINDLIKEYNFKNNCNLPLLQYEKYVALIFNEIERIINNVQRGDFNGFYTIYYKLWLHSDAEVTVVGTNGNKKHCKIIGIDDYGYLLVQQIINGNAKTQCVHPDGNSFDMLQGLIFPK